MGGAAAGRASGLQELQDWSSALPAGGANVFAQGRYLGKFPFQIASQILKIKATSVDFVYLIKGVKVLAPNYK